MLKTQEIIKKFVPQNEQETKDKAYALKAFEIFPNILFRESEFSHICSCAFIINKSKTKVLCVYHNIYNAWSYVGGHADGTDAPVEVAIKEAKEETGIDNLKLLQQEPISLDVLATYGHIKHNKFVCAHTHIALCYLFEGDEHFPIHNKPDENKAVKWLTFDELLELAEDCMKGVYKKIIERIK